MSAALWFPSTAEVAVCGLALALAALIAVIARRIWLARRVSPEERERQRCEHLAGVGKMGDATLIEFHEGLLFYSYEVGGLEYFASQDISRLEKFLPPEWVAHGAASMRYDPRNPANSIVLAETWSGLRPGRPGRTTV
jgi:hypothetical protein